MVIYSMNMLSLKYGLIALILFAWCGTSYGQCTFPSPFVSSTWRDSRHGTVVFATTSLTGFSTDFGSYGTINSWDCHIETFSTDGRILLRSSTTIEILFTDWYIYICISLTEITTDSYVYYRLNGKEDNALDSRVRTVQQISAGTVTIANSCDAVNGASGSEFAVMIKSGQEANTYIECPAPLLGRFNFTYTDPSGTTYCNDPNNPEHMNVCTDKTQLQFDVPCSQSPVYAPASVYCVYSLEMGGDTFVQLYNPGSSDDSTTYKFSCMAIASSNSLTATIVYNNCTADMTSSTAALDRAGNVIGSTLTFSPYVFCQGGCAWPGPFASSTWLDSTRGTITFGANTLSGFSLTVTGTTISNWECLDNSYFAGEKILLIKSTDTFVVVGSTWITYLCLQMTEVSTNSFTYYQKAEQDEKGAYNRALFSMNGLLTDKNTICSGSAVPSEEFHFMVKQGEELNSIQMCGSYLLSKFDYQVTDTSSTVTCDSSTDNWDVCTNTSKMSFDYTTCATVMAYSDGGEVYCMATVAANGFQYQTVYNPSGTPNKFACIVSNSAGSAASFVSNNCTVGQTPTSYAKHHDGTNIGYLTTMTKTESCFTTTTTTTTTSTTSSTTSTTSGGSTVSTTGGGSANTAASTDGGDNGGGSIIPMIVGAVVGILLILVILFLIYWFCYRKRKFCFKKKDVGHSDANGTSPATANGHVNEKPMKIEELIDNPAITADPGTGRNIALTPLPPKPGMPDTTPRVLPPILNEHHI